MEILLTGTCWNLPLGLISQPPMIKGQGLLVTPINQVD